MEQKQFNVGIIVILVIIVVIIIGGIFYFQNNTKTTKPTDTSISQKSLVEYYETRINYETLGINNAFLMKAPDELGLNEITSIKIACPENADGPCGGELLILSPELLHAGNQEFYLAQEGGAGYTYYGPFLDNLENLVIESQVIDSLK